MQISRRSCFGREKIKKNIFLYLFFKFTKLFIWGLSVCRRLDKMMAKVHKNQRIYYIHYLCRRLDKMMAKIRKNQRIYYIHYLCRRLDKMMAKVHKNQRIYYIHYLCRRLDKMMAKIHKNQRIYVAIDWKAVSNILSGEGS